MTEIEILRAELAEVREMVENLTAILYRRKLSPYDLRTKAEWRRIKGGTHLLWLDSQFWDGLAEADLLTLEEVAARTRDEVAAIRGVGPKTIERLEAAMAVEGLTWEEAD